MTTRQRVRPRRAPARTRKPVRKLPRKIARKPPPKPAPEPGRFLPTHLRYTPALLDDVRRRFVETSEPIASLAADLGVADASVHRIARRYGWLRRHPSPPPRDLAPALRLLQQASAATEASVGATAAPPPALSTIDRLERAVLAELATVEAMRTALGSMPEKPAGAVRTVRTLNVLTQTLQHIQRLRASATLQSKPDATEEPDHDDDLPADIDEFRNELARRIRAFVASRADRTSDRADAPAAPVGEA